MLKRERDFGMGDVAKKRIVFPSRLGQIVPVQNRIFEDVKAAAFPQQAEFAIRLALDEALANAVKHGNKLDPAKHVTVEYSVTPDRFEIQVCDQGPGFTPAMLPDPTAQENLTRPHGRGVMLMRAYMTEVDFNDRGNCVRLVKTRDCPLPAAD